MKVLISLLFLCTIGAGGLHIINAPMLSIYCFVAAIVGMILFLCYDKIFNLSGTQKDSEQVLKSNKEVEADSENTSSLVVDDPVKKESKKELTQRPTVEAINTISKSVNIFSPDVSSMAFMKKNHPKGRHFSGKDSNY